MFSTHSLKHTHAISRLPFGKDWSMVQGKTFLNNGNHWHFIRLNQLSPCGGMCTSQVLLNTYTKNAILSLQEQYLTMHFPAPLTVTLTITAQYLTPTKS